MFTFTIILNKMCAILSGKVSEVAFVKHILIAFRPPKSTKCDILRSSSTGRLSVSFFFKDTILNNYFDYYYDNNHFDYLIPIWVCRTIKLKQGDRIGGESRTTALAWTRVSAVIEQQMLVSDVQRHVEWEYFNKCYEEFFFRVEWPISHRVGRVVHLGATRRINIIAGQVLNQVNARWDDRV